MTKHKARAVSYTNDPRWYRCPQCDKRTYDSRKSAKIIARRMGDMNGEPRASAYECIAGTDGTEHTGRWHTGRLAPAVIYGQRTRDEVYERGLYAHELKAAA